MATVELSPTHQSVYAHEPPANPRTSAPQEEVGRGKKTHKPPRRTQRTGMHTLQNTMPLPIDLRHPLPSRQPPRQKHHAPRPDPGNRIDDLLGKFLPSLIRVAIRVVRADRQTRVQQQDAAVGPGRQEAAVFRRGRFEGRVVFGQGEVDVFERWRGRSRRADGETEAVRLVVVVVGVLA